MKKFIILLSAIVLTVSCSSDDSSNNNDDIIPQNLCQPTIPFLMEGRTLNYVVAGSSGSSLTIGACDPEQGFLVSRIAPFGNGTDLWRQNGDFLEVDSNNNGDYFSKNFKLNATVGETWTYTQPSGDVITREVISVDSTITVPAGTFTCTVISYQDSGTINTTYVFWDEQIGEIKEDAGFFTLELESYE